MERTKWVDRVFKLGLPSGWLPNVLVRLDGVTPRLKNLTESLSDKQTSTQLNDHWSIKEHIGHLIDLETLHIGRIQDFIDRKMVLRAADMGNKKTYTANHNQKPVDYLITAFKSERDHFIASLKNLDDSIQEFVSTHPRLNIPMRVVDMAFFTAEHDDHHIACINEIVESFK